MMHDVLACVQNLNDKSKEIFDRLEAACGQANAKILQLEDRLAVAAARVEAARGSTAALKVESARTFCGRGKPGLGTAHLVVDESLLLSLHQPANLPEELGAGLPSASTSAEELARVSRSVTHHCSLPTPDPALKKSRNEKLLPVGGRLSSVSELFLLNSCEQPYRARHEVDNLADVEDDAFLKPRSRSDSTAKNASQRQDATNRVDLEEDEPERATEDLRFRPRPATAEVTFDLPEVLPDLGHVAHIVWTEGDTNETDRPAWDVAPADLARRASMAKPRPQVREVPKRQAPPQPKPLATPQPQAPQAVAAPPPKETVKAKPSQPPPAPKAKGDGKGKGGKGKGGKGKGKGPPPPPPAKKQSAAPPAKPPAMKAEGMGKAAMFADIRSGAKLRKCGPPKERSGAAVGRVV